MLDTRIACPACGKRLKMSDPVALGDRLRCPQCLHSFDVEARNFFSAGRPETSPLLAMPTPFEGTPAPTLPPDAPQLPSPSRGGKGLLIAVCAGIMLLAIGGGLAIGLSNSKKNEPVAQKKQSEPERDTLPRSEAPATDTLKEAPQPQDNTTDGKGPRLGDLPPAGEPIVRRDPLPPPTVPPAPLSRSTLPAEKQEEVNKAIDRGVAFLRKTQTQSGSWLPRGQHSVGMAALPGLTLLECGVDRKDLAVQAALAYVRREAPSVMMTYDISLAILFLDRFGDARDRRLIQSLALRLMAGQQPSGGWTYHCPHVFDSREELAFFDVLQQTRPKDPLQLFDRDKNDERMAFFVNVKDRMEGMTGRIESPLSARIDGQSAGPLFGQFAPKMVGRIESTSPNAATIPLEQIKSPKLRLEDVPKKLHDVPILQPIPRSKDLPASDVTDNSNTQFAILGVWAAARHNIPMERTLAMLVKRFRTSQNADGSWGYRYQNGGGAQGSPAMNASGLLGLAVGHGLISGVDPAKGPATAKDPAIQAALKSLSMHLDATPPPVRPGRQPGRRMPPRRGPAADTSCYFLWSVERVGVLYNLPIIGDSDWYAWGVDILLKGQQNGAWPGGVGNSDTCLALLFLKRANLTHDLSTRIGFAQLAEKKD